MNQDKDIQAKQQCKCEIKSNYVATSITNVMEYLGGIIVYCPLHAAAADLLSSLILAVELLEDSRVIMDRDRVINLDRFLPSITQVISKAEVQ